MKSLWNTAQEINNWSCIVAAYHGMNRKKPPKILLQRHYLFTNNYLLFINWLIWIPLRTKHITNFSQLSTVCQWQFCEVSFLWARYIKSFRHFEYSDCKTETMCGYQFIFYILTLKLWGWSLFVEKLSYASVYFCGVFMQAVSQSL